MSYRLPEPGEVWPHKHLPERISAAIVDRDAFTGVVTFDARTEINGNVKTSRRQSAVTVFVHQYRPPESPNGSGDEVVAESMLGHGDDLTVDPPPAEMWGVPL